MAAKRTNQISEVNVREISIVDNPAVPKAKVRLFKSNDLTMSKALVGGLTSSITELLSSLKDNWSDLEEDVQKKAVDVFSELGRSEKSLARADILFAKGFLSDNWSSETDWVLSDVNYVTGMLQSVMSYFRFMGDSIKSEDGKAKIDEIAGYVLPALMESSKLFTMTMSELCPGVAHEEMAGTLDYMEEAVAKMKARKEDSAAGIAPEKVEEVIPSWAKVLVDAISGMKATIDSLSARTAIIESEDGKETKPAGEASSDEPVEVVEVTGFSVEQMEALLNGGLDGMTEDERSSVLTAIEQQLSVAEVE